VSTFGGSELGASLLLLNELHFLRADDPRFASTVAAVERELKRGEFVFRYVEADDFGSPENAFIVCSFWLVDALCALGRREEALVSSSDYSSFGILTECSRNTVTRRRASCGGISRRRTATWG
jgi:GH15 family glucan-1,4-alpha-glucosidase